MYNFFAEKNAVDGIFEISGKDYNHAKNVLRLKTGEKVIINFESKSNLCEITEYDENRFAAKILKENYSETSLPVDIYLFQGLLKGDKTEFVIQKAVELGVKKIFPVEMRYSVSKIEEKKKNVKTERFNAIAEAAAKQCKSNFITTVEQPLRFESALEIAKDLDLFLMPYECHCGMDETVSALKKITRGMKIGVLIGPEGGIDREEYEKAVKANALPLSLGKRILRAETAAITAISMIMLYTEAKL